METPVNSHMPLPAIVERVMAGRLLEDLRDRAGLTQKDVADALGWSQPKMVNIETGQTSPRPVDLDRLLDHLGATADEREIITGHRERGREQAPKRHLRWKFSNDMRLVIDLESSAPLVRCHTGMIVPGLTQTENHMRHLMDARRPAWPPDDIDNFVANRLARQRVLDNVDQRFEFIIDQAALNRMSNMPSRHEQLRHLLELADRPNIDLRLVPDSHGFYLGQEVDYWIFEYDNVEPTASLVYAERYDDVDVLHDGNAVRKYQTLWREQKRAALDANSARTFLAILAGTSRAS